MKNKDLPSTYTVKEGVVYIRHQGTTYCVKLGEFKLIAKPGQIEVQCSGILK